LENVDIFYGHFECFTDIWDILRPIGTLCVHLVHFSGFGIVYQEKSGNPASVEVVQPITNVWLGVRERDRIYLLRNAPAGNY
jgi:hypothetical protein